MQVAILGPLEITHDAQPVEVNGGRLRALLTRLALDADRVVTIDTLAASLWEDDEPADVANALQSLVSRLRRALPADVVESRPGGYRLVIPRTDVDAVKFEALARDGRDRLREGDAEAAASRLREALALWRGPALADVADAPFAAAPAAQLDEARRSTREDRIEADLALGRHSDVVAELESLVASFPLRERLTVLLVTALAGSGRPADALTAYERTRAVLADELGTDPSPELQALHSSVLRGEIGTAQPTAPAPTTQRPTTNLPSALTTFRGRETELARISELLADHRLVTLVGPGGAGKTRLACEGAAQAVGTEPVWLVELAPVTDAADIAQAALGVLDLRDANVLDTRRPGTSQDALERLVAALRSKPALVVLDNCEHLIEGAARFADHLLTHCPELRVVATSREPLGITGEMLCPVPPLGAPPTGTSAADAVAYPAVSLFVDRAAAVSPGFGVDDTNVADVIEICRRLDGQPLAIELAAARLRTMPTALLATRLDDRFRLLTGGSRTAVARHRTLRAVVEWSWDLLGEPERRLVEIVAVFPGGATAEAIHEVAADCGITATDVTATEDLLGELAAKSLLQVGTSGDGPQRYRMLETIREFGVEQLMESGDVAAVRRAHARHYRDLAERLEPRLRTADQLRWFAALEQERDNLLAALRFAADDGDADTAVRLGAALGWFWWSRGSHAEVTMWLGVALAVDGDSPAEARAVALVIYTISSWESGSSHPDLPALGELLVGLPSLNALTGHPLLAVVGPMSAILRNDQAETERQLALNSEHPDAWARATVSMLEGLYAENDGDIARQRRAFERALVLFEEVGDRWGLGTVSTALGGMRELDGDLDGAHAAFVSGLAFADEIRATSDRAQILTRLALVDLRRDDVDEAEVHLDEARRLAESTGARQALAGVDTATAAVGLYRGDLVTARRALDAALLRYPADEPGGVPQIDAWVAACFCLLAVAEGDLGEARDAISRAVRIAVAERDMPVLAGVTVHAATLAVAEDDFTTAAALLAAADDLRGAEDRTDPVRRGVIAALDERWGAEATTAAIEAARTEGREHAIDVLTTFAHAR